MQHRCGFRPVPARRLEGGSRRRYGDRTRFLDDGLMALTFIHAADLHLDSPLRGLAAYPEAPVERLRGASRRAFSRLVDIAVERAVAFVVLPGDVWDGDWPDVGTGLYFAREMGRLQRAGIPAFLIRGNHDAESRLTRSIVLPESVRVFRADRPETMRLEAHGAALHGQSFDRPDVTENLARNYPDAVPGAINIGLLHTALEGSADHARYAPCRLAELQARGYDYWALGHVHEHAVLAAGRGGADGGTIAFSGVLQGRHAREIGAKGALLVTVDEHRVTLERLVVDVVRWHEAAVDLTGADTMETVARRIGDALRTVAGAADADDRLAAVRLVLGGRTALHGRLDLERRRVRDEALAQAAAVAPDSLFVERVRLATRPAVESATVAARRDALAELQGLLARAPEDAALASSLTAYLAEMLQLLPPEARAALREADPERVAAIEEGRADTLVPAAAAALVDRLAEP